MPYRAPHDAVATALLHASQKPAPSTLRSAMAGLSLGRTDASAATDCGGLPSTALTPVPPLIVLQVAVTLDHYLITT